ncbi:hypothetical protein [Draconibacterium halophilum]|uniref:hypothetical protein n=1 Tax=Draconibacterium halophilum TaxID=2706887 RepID=UPI00193EFEC8|nr:hypothetical protein [Draconibacterium halophilum]
MKQRLLLLTLLFSTITAMAQEWPDWRGPNRDGVWNESGITEKFESEIIPVKWSVSIGPGYSGQLLPMEKFM